jgi:hypothetical protein
VGGSGAALSAAGAPVHSLAVRTKPKSGATRELLDFEEISKDAIVRKITALKEEGCA